MPLSCTELDGLGVVCMSSTIGGQVAVYLRFWSAVKILVTTFAVCSNHMLAASRWSLRVGCGSDALAPGLRGTCVQPVAPQTGRWAEEWDDMHQVRWGLVRVCFCKQALGPQ